MEDREQFFISESIAHARVLSLPDCVHYLEGFVAAIGAEHPAASKLRGIYRALGDSDQQLDLIQIGQLKFNLAPTGRGPTSAAPTKRVIAKKGARR